MKKKQNKWQRMDNELNYEFYEFTKYIQHTLLLKFILVGCIYILQLSIKINAYLSDGFLYI